jgi:glucosamine--fructose-6-phosphate aminotransferase (isomerizing)|tara:strand:+ start:5625 stop:7445 length:1821 start_codon:yes stop_codon:yes gene_type:complete
MCGIFGSVADKVEYKSIKRGLKNLAYRGYDSAGIAVATTQGVINERVEGHPKFLPDLDTFGTVAIGHNRWATHSPPTKENSHPYTSNDNKISLVHNGIIENYVEIRAFLEQRGFTFYSQTDTEVLPNLIQHYLFLGEDLQTAMRHTAKHVEGAFGVIFIHADHPNQMNLMKLGSPMYVGRADDAVYVCSDSYSFPEEVKTFSSIDDSKILIIRKDSVDVQDLNGTKLTLIFEEKDVSADTYCLGKHKHYMQKEIHEQFQYVVSALAGRIRDTEIKLGGLQDCIEDFASSRQVVFTGCGSAHNAALVGSLAMEEVGRLLCRQMPAGELKYTDLLIDDKTWLVTVSQSGETADVIGCIKNIKAKGAKVLGVVNTPNSTIYQMTDCGIHIRAGKEVSVASTKAVTNQILAQLLLAYKIGLENGCSYKDYKNFLLEVQKLPYFINKVIAQEEKIKGICGTYKDSKTAFVVGRNVLEHIAREIALKIKEISYIHAEGYSGSELKHGPLALIDDQILNICLLDKNFYPKKTISNIEEIRARGGKVILVTNYTKQEIGNKIYDRLISVETGENKFITAMVFNVVGQLMSYYFALHNNRNVDLPRNLAKSVTVE